MAHVCIGGFNLLKYRKSSNWPPGGLFIFDIFGWGLFRGGGAYTWMGAYKIIVDIEKTLLKDVVCFGRNFFMSI